MRTLRGWRNGLGNLAFHVLYCGSANAFNKAPCYRAERAILESHDSDGPPLRGKLDWKDLERLIVVAKAQHRSREHRHEPRTRDQLTAQMN
jgi:hypothetical protein